MILLFLVVLIIGVVVLFSVQNATPVVVTFITWQFSASLAVVVFLSAVCGMCIMALIFGSMRVKRSVKRQAAPQAKGPAAAPTQGPASGNSRETPPG